MQSPRKRDYRQLGIRISHMTRSRLIGTCVRWVSTHVKHAATCTWTLKKQPHGFRWKEATILLRIGSESPNPLSGAWEVKPRTLSPSGIKTTNNRTGIWVGFSGGPNGNRVWKVKKYASLPSIFIGPS